MSGSGGFYKYRCKYFYSKQCPEWVYVNGDPCPDCLRKGLDASEDNALMWPGARDVCVPVIQDGYLQYAVMELVSPDASGAWTLRAKVVQPPPVSNIGVSAELPRPRPLPSPAIMGGSGPIIGGRY